MSEQELLDDSWIDASEPDGAKQTEKPVDLKADRRNGLLIVGAMVAFVLFLQFTVTSKAILGAVLFLLIIVPMVLFHEWGHYWTAKKSGIASKEFFIGFGPRIWSYWKGETEYGIKAGFPLGGYVRIVGMSQYEEVEDRFKGRTFRDAKAWKRAVVLVAGSTTHFISAIVLGFVLLVFFGNPLATSTVVENVAANGAAATAGLEPGDEIVAIDGASVEGDWSAVQETISTQPGETLRIEVIRDGEPLTLTTTPESEAVVTGIEADSSAVAEGLQPGVEIVAVDGVNVEGDWAAAQEQLAAQPDEPVEIEFARGDETRTVVATPESLQLDGATEGRLGIGPAPEKLSPAEAVPGTFVFFGELWWTSMAGLGDVFAPSNLQCIANQIGGGECETANRFISPVGVGQIAVVSVEAGLDAFLILLIAINIFVGTLNLLPLLPFDGGHLAVLGYEQAASRIKGREIEVDQAKLIPITVAVLGLLGIIFLSSVYLDATAGLPGL